MQKTKAVEGFHFKNIDFAACIERNEPCIFRGALNDNPIVVAGRESNEAAMSHLLSYKNEQPLLYYSADADSNSRFFYNKQIDGFNYATAQASLADIFASLNQENQKAEGGSIYVGSTEVADHFPGLLDFDQLHFPEELFEEGSVFTGVWLGNRSTAATHYDVSNNAAACLVGKRRFTLFPPDQINNLYPGPLEPTPGGQVVSMVDLNSPDFEEFPNFANALKSAEVAELEAGDVLVYPAMWWHQVEALNEFNVLLNYWWNAVPSFVDDPMNTVLHGLLSLRDRPEHERRAWRSVFDYYVFGDAASTRNHLPEHSWGVLSDFDSTSARRHRAKLLKKINR